MMKGDRGERRRDLALLSVKDDITLHTWERGVSQKMTKGDLGEQSGLLSYQNMMTFLDGEGVLSVLFFSKAFFLRGKGGSANGNFFTN